MVGETAMSSALAILGAAAMRERRDGAKEGIESPAPLPRLKDATDASAILLPTAFSEDCCCSCGLGLFRGE